jgi:hypothetical protein
MRETQQQLIQQLREVSVLIEQSQARLKQLEQVPDGAVKASKCRTTQQYYVKSPGEQKWVYAPADKLPLVKGMVQKDYELKVYRQLQEVKRRLEQLIKSPYPESILLKYEDLCDGKKCLVDPILLSDEMYIEKWRASLPGSQNPKPRKDTFETNAGELVRSKSEKIIADYLLKEGIPYVYEPCLVLKGRHSVYPDFAVLNVSERKTYYWEHLGRTGEGDYAVRNFAKLAEYEENGIILGEKLLVTIESDVMPLDIEAMMKKIDMYLK